ncbi:MAG: Rieske 2Fe-2S domain-containing protein [Elusimicrobia bacterium]|nr:Rieske 2Fe-2S domain-containing protein [Elusimicrobiota bacterium]
MMDADALDREEDSRLAPEPMDRRDFLGLSACAAAASALGFGSLGILRLPKPGVLSSPSKKFRVTLPESLLPGQAFVPQGRPVAVYRDDGGVFAISLVCTHLGCVVKPTAEGFECPCHGSRFGPGGLVKRGPAPKALPWLSVKPVAGRSVIVDEGTAVPNGTKAAA